MFSKTPEIFINRNVNKIFTEEDAWKFINKVGEKYNNDDNQRMMLQALIVLLYKTGCRISEIVFVPNSKHKELYKYGLFHDDVSFTKDYIIIKIKTAKKKSKKNFAKPRYIWVKSQDDMFEYFLRWYITKRSGDPLFPIHRGTAWEKLKQIAFLLGYKENEFWLHYFRTSGVSRDIQAGGNPFEVQEKYGWSSVRFFETYSSLNIEMTKGLADKEAASKQALNIIRDNNIKGDDKDEVPKSDVPVRVDSKKGEAESLPKV